MAPLLERAAAALNTSNGSRWQLLLSAADSETKKSTWCLRHAPSDSQICRKKSCFQPPLPHAPPPPHHHHPPTQKQGERVTQKMSRQHLMFPFLCNCARASRSRGYYPTQRYSNVGANNYSKLLLPYLTHLSVDPQLCHATNVTACRPTVYGYAAKFTVDPQLWLTSRNKHVCRPTVVVNVTHQT